MLIQRISRQKCLRQAAAQFKKITWTSPTQARQLHHVPVLDHEAALRENGIPGLLSPGAFDMAWTEYQGSMIEKLSAITAGTTREHMSVHDITLETARDPLMANTFNYASMAWNNHFFFNGMFTDPNPDANRPLPNSTLHALLTRRFSSLDTLRAEFLSTARATFGPAFVWLVYHPITRKQNTQFSILTTYLAGSPHSGAHWRVQSEDMNTQNVGSARAQGLGEFSAAAMAARQQMGSTGAPGIAGSSANAGWWSQSEARGRKVALGGIDSTPLLCVNTWEHVWMWDWGVRNKGKFLEAWWDRIDWEKVSQRMSLPEPSRVGETQAGMDRVFDSEFGKRAA
ncbi:Fe superoxide dismutase [Eremomyces bilateralis CBS 781.70]|uniref:Fe superoxide dismutase n=1 Tax=Eremomyces bilateralis CBS 781.70 TaxID=1392243 RepID=A0A6G1GD39_9PEZI|nr:Fe superoxide dismutase [Eremomyces bilateralis CBS 781.70]KAF1815811.1 Fe superoxide dismutase [Eremomyces bilateralis CBS 781.70]